MQNDRVYGKTSVELNREANSDIYRMFSNLDVSSKEKFVSSFTKAVDSFKNYYAGGEVVELAKKDAKNNVYMGNEFMNLRKSVTRYYNGTTGIT